MVLEQTLTLLLRFQSVVFELGLNGQNVPAPRQLPLQVHLVYLCDLLVEVVADKFLLPHQVLCLFDLVLQLQGEGVHFVQERTLLVVLCLVTCQQFLVVVLCDVVLLLQRQELLTPRLLPDLEHAQDLSELVLQHLDVFVLPLYELVEVGLPLLHLDVVHLLPTHQFLGQFLNCIRPLLQFLLGPA